MKFYLDEDLPATIAGALRRRGFDAVSAYEVGNRRLSDEGQLAFAARAGRALVSHNAQHFIRISREALTRHEPHAGIILCPPSIEGREIGAITNALIRLAGQYPHGLGEYDVVYVSRGLQEPP